MISLKEKILFIESKPQLAVFVSVSIGTFVGGCFALVVAALPPRTDFARASDTEGRKQEFSTQTKALALATVPQLQTDVEKRPIQEVNIANNGQVYIRGARVESVSGTTIMISTTWNSTKMQWLIHTNASQYGKRHFGTKFLDRSGEMISLSDIRIGDTVSVSGSLRKDQADLVVDADVVRTF